MSEDTKPPESLTARLVRSEALTPEVTRMEFKVIDQSSFDFRPGQYICMMQQQQGEVARRYYSIASAPDGTNRFELCVGGSFLAEPEPGMSVGLEGPVGNFLLREPLRKSVFLAHGTGIAPIRAMLRHLFADEDKARERPPMTLIFGARTPEYLYFQEEFQAIERRHPNFRFYPTLSRADNGWSGRQGHVQAHLDEAMGNDGPELDVYFCGRPEMVAEVRAQLVERGFDEEAIIHEKY
jgi:CDP-4-dehydro-6-deoxyglucose reductase